jgi:hypothetical protein
LVDARDRAASSMQCPRWDPWCWLSAARISESNDIFLHEAETEVMIFGMTILIANSLALRRDEDYVLVYNQSGSRGQAGKNFILNRS